MKYVSIRIKNDNGFSNRAYTFKTHMDNIKEQDWVVCESVHGLIIGKVEVIVPKPDFKCRWVLERIDIHETIKFLERLEGS